MGTLTSMSEQQLVDCSKANLGCNGGSMESGFQFEQGVNVATESSYPYTARAGSCKSSGYTTAVPRGGVTGYKSVSSSTSALQSALQHGPVSVAIEADQYSFQGYSGGVITSGCGTSLDHGVTAVGYTSDYFIVKNSWGTSWGKWICVHQHQRQRVRHPLGCILPHSLWICAGVGFQHFRHSMIRSGFWMVCLADAILSNRK